nr:immunoglobulin heavy chain junction region [Mus musculus]
CARSQLRLPDYW